MNEEKKSPKKRKLPQSKVGKILFNLAVTLLIGFLYFYLTLPALNLHAQEFYLFILLLCLVYIVCALLTSGAGLSRSKSGIKEYFRFIKSQCLPVGILVVAMLVVTAVGGIISAPIFRAGDYRDLLQPETGDFTADITQISFDKIPTLDRDSAEYLSDRQMGTLSDMVSQFEYSDDSTQINYQGRPVRVAPRIAKTIGLFGGTDIVGAVLVDAVTGACTYYDTADVPTWVDNLFDPDLVMQQYDYHGTLVNGFINSIFGQRDVTQTTQGYNYIAMNDDVYMYTGVTSANADQSNLGFLLCNLRTKETKYYSAPGATEYAAMASAQGVVQDLGYIATFPILLNIGGEPTYFIPMKDAANLVKTYAMVNVSRYDIVATGSTVSDCERAYARLLSSKGISTGAGSAGATASGVIAEIRSAVLEGNTYYFIRLEGEQVFYSLSAAQNTVAVILDVGDRVTIEHTPDTGSGTGILTGYSVTLERKNS